MKVKPRRKLGVASYLESDRDYVLNNLAACVKWLDSQSDANRPSWEKFPAKEWALALQGLTPGGSEFLTPQECAAWIRHRTNYPPVIIRQREQIAELEKRVADLQGALEQFCYYVSKGGGSLGKNPYCVQEFKNAMCAVARARGLKTENSAWMDALDGIAGIREE